MSHRSSTARATLLAAASAAFAACLIAATPVRALDDGDQSIFDTVKGILGAGIGFNIGGGDDKPRIDYRERAPLVLPPSTAHPQPTAPVAQRNAAWPKDYDSERLRQARSGAPKPLSSDDDGNFGGMSARDIRNTGRLQQNPARNPAAENCRDGDLGELCNPTEFWRVMKTTSAPADTSRDLVAGQEPPRARLTDPPKGFRAAKSSQKYTFEVKEEVNVADPRAQIRDEARRARQVD